MLSISKPIKGAEGIDYYLDLCSADYYLEGGEPPGVWYGGGADHLGLKGEVDPVVLKSLFTGYSPDSWQRLVRNAGSEHRQCGWDLTFSAPKSVSVVWGTQPKVRAELQAAHDVAVRHALDYLEDKCGQLNKTRDKADVLFAIFNHGSSRANDPQLHSHCLLANVAFALETGVLTIHEFFRHKMAAGSLYRAHLAYEIRQRLPLLDLERKGTWFEIKCVPQAIIDFFSKRREQVKQAMAQYGEENARVAEIAALSSRPDKKTVSREKLFADWEGIGRDMKFRLPEYVHDLSVPRERAQDAVEHIIDKRSHFAERDLLRALCDLNQAGARSAPQLLAEANAALGELVDLGRHRNEHRYSTKELLALEKELINEVNGLRHDEKLMVPEKRVARHLAGKDLSKEQIDAVRHITATPGLVKVVDGLAGTGKSTMLKNAREIWEAQGYTVIGGTISGKAADGLQASSGIPSETIAWLKIALNKPKGIDFGRYWHGGRLVDNIPVADSFVGKQVLGGATYRSAEPREEAKIIDLDRALHGGPLVANMPVKDSFMGKLVLGDPRPTGVVPPAKFELGPKTVLVLDEASMIGTKDMAWIIKRIKECGTKLVFTGDSGQLPSIDAGGFFESLGQRIGRAVLSEIRRQVEPWARDMVHLFAGGEPLAGLRELAERGHVVLKDTMHDVRSALIKEWGEHTVRPANVILTGTTAEARKLNTLAQEERLRRSEIHKGGFSFEKTDYHVGDRMIFLKNSRTMGVKNGTTGTIKNIRRAEPHLWHRRVTVKIDGGKEICFSTRNYQDFDLAYAMTTHKAQGMTVDKAFVLVQENHENRELAYVQVSRATTMTKLFMTHDTAGDELGEIAKNMGFSRAQTLATDMKEKSQGTGPENSNSSKSKDSSSRSR